MRDLDSGRMVDHVLHGTRTDRDDAAFRVVAQAAKRNVLDFLLRAYVLADNLYGDFVGILAPRDMVKDVMPISLFEVKVLHGEDLFSDRDLECLGGVLSLAL